MPAFGNQFTEVGLRVVTAWVRGLGRSPAAPEPR
jgi:hypothetical protein